MAMLGKRFGAILAADAEQSQEKRICTEDVTCQSQNNRQLVCNDRLKMVSYFEFKLLMYQDDILGSGSGITTSTDLAIEATKVTELKTLDVMKGRFGEVKRVQLNEESTAIMKIVNDNHMNWEWELKFPILSDCPEIAMPLGFLKYGADNYLFFEDGGIPLTQFSDGNNWKFRLQFNLSMMRALVALSERKIVHLDIKPDNVVMKQDGDRFSFKLIDFGGSCYIDHLKPTIHITHEYSCPKLLRFLRKETKDLREVKTWLPKCDVFSVGLVNSFIMAGKHTYAPNYTSADHPSQARKLYPAVQHDALDKVVLKMLRPRPETRVSPEEAQRYLELLPLTEDQETVSKLAEIFHEERSLSLPLFL